MYPPKKKKMKGAQWLSGRVLDSRPRGWGFEPHQHHCVVSLSKNINPSSVPVQPRKTHPFITERLLMGCKQSNQLNKQTNFLISQPKQMLWVLKRNISMKHMFRLMDNFTLKNFAGTPFRLKAWYLSLAMPLLSQAPGGL